MHSEVLHELSDVTIRSLSESVQTDDYKLLGVRTLLIKHTYVNYTPIIYIASSRQPILFTEIHCNMVCFKILWYNNLVIII